VRNCDSVVSMDGSAALPGTRITAAIASTPRAKAAEITISLWRSVGVISYLRGAFAWPDGLPPIVLADPEQVKPGGSGQVKRARNRSVTVG
jgi:hypothetical protein